MRHLPQVVADPPCSPCVHPWCTPVNEWALTTVACAPVQGHGRSITYTATLVAAMKLKLLSSLLILFSVCEVQAVYCIPPIYGACLERNYEVGNYEVDIDCCAGCGAGSCAPGYTLSTQTAIAEGGSWDRPADEGFNLQCENLYSACNTCCTPTGSVNTGISNTCEVGEPITDEQGGCYHVMAALALRATSQFSGFGYKQTVSLATTRPTAALSTTAANTQDIKAPARTTWPPGEQAQQLLPSHEPRSDADALVEEHDFWMKNSVHVGSQSPKSGFDSVADVPSALKLRVTPCPHACSQERQTYP